MPAARYAVLFDTGLPLPLPLPTPNPDPNPNPDYTRYEDSGSQVWDTLIDVSARPKWLKDLAEQTRERSFVRKQQPTSKALATKDESGKNNSVSTRTGSGKGSESSSADAPDDSLRSPSPLPRPRSAVGAKEAVLV